MDRLALIECRHEISLPTAEFPDESCPKPSDLPSTTDSETHDGRRFERQVDAVALFDEILITIRKDSSNAAKVAELQRIDKRLLQLMQLVMLEAGVEGKNRFTAANATISR